MYVWVVMRGGGVAGKEGGARARVCMWVVGGWRKG